MTTPTPETAMRPEDVPTELVDAFWRAADRAADFSAEGAFRQILAAVLPAHEAMVLSRKAEEMESDPTARVYDAAREQATQDAGHEDGCEWHANGGSYCSCRTWPAACAGVAATLAALRGARP